MPATLDSHIRGRQHPLSDLDLVSGALLLDTLVKYLRLGGGRSGGEGAGGANRENLILLDVVQVAKEDPNDGHAEKVGDPDSDERLVTFKV